MGQWQWRISIVHVDNMYTGAAQPGRQRERDKELEAPSVEIIKIVIGIANSNVASSVNQKGVIEEVHRNDDKQSEKVRGHHGNGIANSEYKVQIERSMEHCNPRVDPKQDHNNDQLPPKIYAHEQHRTLSAAMAGLAARWPRQWWPPASGQPAGRPMARYWESKHFSGVPQGRQVPWFEEKFGSPILLFG